MPAKEKVAIIGSGNWYVRPPPTAAAFSLAQGFRDRSSGWYAPPHQIPCMLIALAPRYECD